MKLLILSQYFWPESFRINDVAEGLAQRGARLLRAWKRTRLVYKYEKHFAFMFPANSLWFHLRVKK